jgi:hypothetical protein
MDVGKIIESYGRSAQTLQTPGEQGARSALRAASRNGARIRERRGILTILLERPLPCAFVASLVINIACDLLSPIAYRALCAALGR